MTLEAYSRWRKEHRSELIAHRRLRTVGLDAGAGEHLLLQFESERTVRYQIQEMLRIEKLFEDEAIRAEIDAYAPLVPDGSNWIATLMLAWPDEAERGKALAQLIGVEDRVYVEVQGLDKNHRIYAIADEDLPRETAQKTSAVHFLRFAFTPETVKALLQTEEVFIGCGHPHYTARQALSPAALAELRKDLTPVA